MTLAPSLMSSRAHTPVPLPFDETPICHPLKRARTSLESLSEPSTWSASHQEEFGEDMCKVFVSCGIPWNVASNPELHLFTEKWIAGARVPDRRVLSGHLLDREVAKVENKMKHKIQGKVATGQCDGWKDCAKTPIITSMITVEHEVSECN